MPQPSGPLRVIDNPREQHLSPVSPSQLPVTSMRALCGFARVRDGIGTACRRGRELDADYRRDKLRR